MEESRGRSVDITSLSAQQLGTVKKQLDDELEHLTSSFTKLRSAQAKFRECLKLVSDANTYDKIGRPLLVPLTASLYAPGELADTGRVIIDIGTGFYIEKTKEEASDFYNSRIDELGHNLKDLEAIVQGKSNNLRAIEDALRQKVLERTTSSSG